MSITAEEDGAEGGGEGRKLEMVTESSDMTGRFISSLHEVWKQFSEETALQSSHHELKDWIEAFKTHLTQRFDTSPDDLYPFSFFVSLLEVWFHEGKEVLQAHDELIATQFVLLMRYFHPTIDSWIKLHDILRTPLILTQQSGESEKNSTEDTPKIIEKYPVVWPSFHFQTILLDTLIELIAMDSPSYFSFKNFDDETKISTKVSSPYCQPNSLLYGPNGCYINLLKVPIHDMNHFTFSAWIYFTEETSTFELFTVDFKGSNDEKKLQLLVSRQPTKNPMEIGGDSQDSFLFKVIDTRISFDPRKNDKFIVDSLPISMNRWHHIMSVHPPGQWKLYIDGHECRSLSRGVENAYVRVESENITCHSASICKRFHGRLAHATFYGKNFGPEASTIAMAYGKYMSHFQYVSSPQCTSDTGYDCLSSRLASQPWSSYSTIKPIVTVTPNAIKPGIGTTLPFQLGSIEDESVVMLPIDASLVCEGWSPIEVTARCEMIVGKSWMEVILAGGNVMLPLYLFSTLLASSNILPPRWFTECGSKVATFTDPSASSASTSAVDEMNLGENSSTIASRLLFTELTYDAAFITRKDGDAVINVACKLLQLLSVMISCHPECKEMFLQMHGFHLIATALQAVPSAWITETVLQSCFLLVQSLGVDAERGHGITSALQGLLFDFRIWGLLNSSLRRLFMSRLLDLIKSSRQKTIECYRAIGLQRLLDTFRLYLSNISLPSASGCTEDDKVIGDAMYAMLECFVITGTEMESGDMGDDIHTIISALQESTCPILVSHLVMVLSSIRDGLPGIDHELVARRFHDVVVMAIWRKRDIPAAIHIQALEIVLNIVQMSVKVPSPGGRSPPLVIEHSPSKLQIVWQNLMMLAQLMKKHQYEVRWGNIEELKREVDKLVDSLHYPAQSNELWVLLPFLPVLVQFVGIRLWMRPLIKNCLEFIALPPTLYMSSLVKLMVSCEVIRGEDGIVIDEVDARLRKDSEEIVDFVREHMCDALVHTMNVNAKPQTAVQPWIQLSDTIEFECNEMMFDRIKTRSLSFQLIYDTYIKALRMFCARFGDSSFSSVLLYTMEYLLRSVDELWMELSVQNLDVTLEDPHTIIKICVKIISNIYYTAQSIRLLPDCVEWVLLRRCIKVLLQNVKDGECVDNVCEELFHFICLLASERCSLISEEEFASLVVFIFLRLRNLLSVSPAYEMVSNSLRTQISSYLESLDHASALPTVVAFGRMMVYKVLSHFETLSSAAFLDQFNAAFNGYSNQVDEEMSRVVTFVSGNRTLSSISSSDSLLFNGSTNGISPRETDSTMDSPMVIIGTDEERWREVRTAIIDDHLEFERERLQLALSTLGDSVDSLRRQWIRLRHTVDSQLLGDSFFVEWELYGATEGSTASRRRVTLRPRRADYAFFQHKATWSEDLPVEGAQKLSAAQLRSRLNDNGVKVTSVGAMKVENVTDPMSEEFQLVDGLSDLSLDRSSGGTGSGAVTSPNGVASRKSMPATLLDELTANVSSLSVGNAPALPYVRTGPSQGATDMSVVQEPLTRAVVTRISPRGATRGVLTVTRDRLLFRSTADSCDRDTAVVSLFRRTTVRRLSWSMKSITSCQLRRFCLRDSALELFFISRTAGISTLFIDFGPRREDVAARTAFVHAIYPFLSLDARQSLVESRIYASLNVNNPLNQAKFAWVSGSMSNFDYLMTLNTLAGRSFNDLCQYPIMPWILSDYTSKHLDLSNPAVFRDLSKPMGALTEERLEEFLRRYKTLRDDSEDGITAFMYGSHYSTAVGVVLHFLVRLQPFADLHREMQNGHFDVADRLFASIPHAFLHNTTQLSEVKELTPEWFTTPDMFRNINSFDFGITQDGTRIGDVELPAWASSPEHFVAIHRQALESPYVSENLHRWIDLIFGYKQVGEEAVKAHNVFYYCTYHGSIDHYAITDDSLRKATELQIAHFGQTPKQLFYSAHPPKSTMNRTAGLSNAVAASNTHMISRTLSRSLDVLGNPNDPTLRLEERMVARLPLTAWNNHSVGMALLLTTESLAVVNEVGVVCFHKYGASDEATAEIAMLHDLGQANLSDPYDGFVSGRFMDHNGTPGLSFEERNRALVKIRDIRESTRIYATMHQLSANIRGLKRLSSSPLIAVFGGYGTEGWNVTLWELDSTKSRVTSAANFSAHRDRVVDVAADRFGSGNVLIASVDASGCVLVWQIHQVTSTTAGAVGNTSTHTPSNSIPGTKCYQFSRRPQRQFFCPQVAAICSSATGCDARVSLDVSWEMNTLSLAVGDKIFMYSLELDELSHTFSLTEQLCDLLINDPPPSRNCVVNGDRRDIFGYVPPTEDTSTESIASVQIAGLQLLVTGLIAVHVISNSGGHSLRLYTLSGHLTGYLSLPVAMTSWSAPARGDILLIGLANGILLCLNSESLQEKHRFTPKDHVSSPITTITVGPDEDRPAAIVYTTSTRDYIFIALPEFLLWENRRQPTILDSMRQSAARIALPVADITNRVASRVSSIAQDAMSRVRSTAFMRGFLSRGTSSNDANS